jgi:hypothetical protein
VIGLVLTGVLGVGFVALGVPLIWAASRAQALRGRADSSDPAERAQLVDHYPRWAVRLGWILGAQLLLVGAILLAVTLDTFALLARA